MTYKSPCWTYKSRIFSRWDGTFHVGKGRCTLGWDVSHWDGTFHAGVGHFTLGWDVSRWDGTSPVGKGVVGSVGFKSLLSPR